MRYYGRKYHENNNPMRIVFFLSIVNLSLGLHEDTTAYIENYKYTRLQEKKVKIRIIYHSVRPREKDGQLNLKNREL